MKMYIKLIIWIAVSALTITLIASCSGPVDREAHQTLLSRIGKTSVTVFPTFVRQKPPMYDSASSTRISDFLHAQNLANAIISDDHVWITQPWRVNEARMFRDSASALSKHVKDHPIDTEYGLMAEYLMAGKETVGVHCYVVDAQGRLAAGVLMNSHHKAFATVQPKTPSQCTDVLLTALKEELVRREVMPESKSR